MANIETFHSTDFLAPLSENERTYFREMYDTFELTIC